ncbi:Transcriptional regulator of nonfermentable carbon utilization [Mortierella polycephala]|uniref:Transcriptional regulator of nonfermentable carbon utilization n=1 Tax=Mortierella polycephala TaxID=41804 RepID=A0A9P6Q8G3_9FUNG|nr:Transcriptional regulator of nonfermentable carbon utilization [Mortierella polycephala]
MLDSASPVAPPLTLHSSHSPIISELPRVSAPLWAEALLTTPSTSENPPFAMMDEDTTTFFDDMMNAPQPTSVNQTMTPSPTTSLPELYHDFFDNHPELCDSDKESTDMDMDMYMDEDVPLIRARTLAEMRLATAVTTAVQVPLIADRHLKRETTIDTINLMNHPQQTQQQQQPPPPQQPPQHSHQLQQQQQQNGGNGGLGHGQLHHTTNGTLYDNSNTNTGSTNSSNSSKSNSNNSGSNNNADSNGGNHNNNNSSRRSDDAGSRSSPDQNQQNETPQRRKKASRACFHCQKAHLTCDDSRPCQRCIKRDLAATCADGVRKKAKYLQDAYEAQQLNAEQTAQQASIPMSTMDLHQQQHQHQLLPDQDQQQRAGNMGGDSQLTDPNALFNFPMSSDYGFGSEAVNLEYSIISTMLSSPTSELNPMSDLSMVENWQRQGSLDAMATLANNNQLQKALAAQGAAVAAAAVAAGTGTGTGTGTGSGTGPAATLNNTRPTHNSVNNAVANSGGTGLMGPGTPTTNPTSTAPAFPHTGSARASKRKFPSNTPENVYANTKQPFNYTDGFHYLLRYVRERMDKEEMMRICRAMAMFRPSFIALIMNLTPEDLIFMEKCFQRTILEFEKLISFSGTPTVVWRRTGEIALVGKEFSLLTQWGRDQLVGKKTYIYELMDNQSAVEYWEKFSTHAFENTEQTVMTTCILLSPTNRVVPCTFCFTIKRDIFDIPLAIVGNFLPILS